MNIEKPSSQNLESAPRLLFKLTLLRHEKPYYRDEGHDLTPEGVEGAKATGVQLKKEGRIVEGENIHFVHSPQARARGTLEFLAEGAGISHTNKRASAQLRMSDFGDRAAFMERVEELGFDQEAIAKDHHTNPSLHEHRPDIIEPASHKKQRLYRALEYLIRSCEKEEENVATTQHVISVSHFELITQLIDDIFGIENIGRYNAPSFGEAVFIDAYATDSPDRILLSVSFDGKKKDVYFDRTKRSVEVLE